PEVQIRKIRRETSVNPECDTAIALTRRVGLRHEFVAVPAPTSRNEVGSRDKRRTEEPSCGIRSRKCFAGGIELWPGECRVIPDVVAKKDSIVAAIHIFDDRATARAIRRKLQRAPPGMHMLRLVADLGATPSAIPSARPLFGRVAVRQRLGGRRFEIIGEN